MFKRSFITALAVITLLLTAAPSYAWLIYYKPAYHGKVIDTETKEPIEEAVVVVEYEKKTLGPVESGTSNINARETLTDKNGEFHFSPYLTIINPLSWTFIAHFIIYKPGYGRYPEDSKYPPPSFYMPSGAHYVSQEELYFDPETFGQTSEVPVRHLAGIYGPDKVSAILGLVELPKLKTTEDRKKMPFIDFRPKDLPLMFKAINEERRRLGLQGEAK